MPFYMITYGITQIEEAYVGETQNDVVQNSRKLINQWPEYACLNNEEMVQMLHSDNAEFDMVKIEAAWQGYDISLNTMIKLYNDFSVPAYIYAS